MGFLSSIWKGVKKTVKKIGKGIKSAFKSFGKFMNKVGILGQVAMFFVMPYVGAALGQAWTAVAGQTAAQAGASAAGAAASATASATASAAATAAGQTAAQAAAAGATAGAAASATATAAATAAGTLGQASGLAAGGSFAQATGKLMQYVGNTVSKGASIYSNITKGITDTLGNFAKTASNNLFGTSFDAAGSFFGPGDSAWSRSTGVNSRLGDLTGSQAKFSNLEATQKANFQASNKIAALDAKTLKAFDQTVAESGSDPRAYGQTEFRSNSVYDKAIQEGTTGFSASIDPKGLATNAKDLMSDPSMFKGIDVAPTIDIGKINVDMPTVPQGSLLGRIGTAAVDAVTGLPERAVTAFEEFTANPFEGAASRVTGAIENKAMQKAGLVDTPEYTTNYTTSNAYVPSFESFGGSQQQYGASEIMNARSFEQNVTNNSSPYGYTAFQYGNYMSQNA
tara:strand:+ start:4948 stop:6309 length:1362 start_codon:yes stop_codon:yes gene_type:complete